MIHELPAERRSGATREGSLAPPPLTSGPSGVASIAEDGCIAGTDAAFACLFGSPEGDLAGLRATDLLHPDEAVVRAALEHGFAGLRPGPFAGESRCARRDGAVFQAHVSASFTFPFPGGRRGSVLVIEDVGDRRRLEQRIALQHEVARLLSGRTKLGEEVLEVICEGLDWDIGVLWVLGRDGRHLRFLQSWSAPDVAVTEFLAHSRQMRFEPGAGLPGLAWARREPVWIEDVPTAGPNFVRGEVAAREGLHSAFAFPLTIGDGVLGVMDFFSRHVRKPDADLLRLTVTIGSQIGQFIGRRRAESALRGSQKQLEAILDNTIAAIYVTHAVGSLMLINRRAERLFGVSKEDAFEKTFDDLFSPAEADAYRARHERALAADALQETEEVIPDESGPRTYLAHSFPLRDVALQPYAVCVLLTDITDRKRAEEDVRALAADLSAAEDAARRRLARDIHDSIGQTLSALKIDLGRAPRKPEGHGELRASLERALAVVDDLIAQTRSLTFDLYPAMLDDLGLVPTLHGYVEQWSRRTGVQGTVTERGARRATSTTVTNYLFRAIKELLNNTFKHARATKVILAVHWSPARLRIMVADDGRGFDPVSALDPRRRHGLGLADIRQRVAHMGGELIIEAKAGEGAQVILELPLEDGDG